MSKDYYFLFSADNMPLAVFLTKTSEESKELFYKLYRSSWEDMIKVGIYMKKEQDVPDIMWDEIHDEYLKRKKKDSIKVVPKINPDDLRNKAFELNKTKFIYEQGVTKLETEKYLSGKW